MPNSTKYAGMYYRDQFRLIHLPSGEVFKSWADAKAHEKWLAEWEAKWGVGDDQLRA